jgi:small subunit ribosomal protein S20
LAHSDSARKRIRQNVKRRLRNRSSKSALRTAIKRFRSTVAGGDAEAARAAYAAVQKKADTVARKGIIHAKTAARIKARLARHLQDLQAA